MSYAQLAVLMPSSKAFLRSYILEVEVAENTKSNCAEKLEHTIKVSDLRFFVLFRECPGLKAFVSSLICIGFVPDCLSDSSEEHCLLLWIPQLECLPIVSGIVCSDSPFGLTAPSFFFGSCASPSLRPLLCSESAIAL